ncbi:hypothetical protein ACOMHN_026109 [Nucella lapillus]
MIWSTIVVLLLVFAIGDYTSASRDGVYEDECIFAGLSGSRKLYLAQNCRPKNCTPTVPTEGLTCTIGNYVDHMPGTCKNVERALTAKGSHPLPPVEEICQPLLTELSLYDYRCRQLNPGDVEKALRLVFSLPLCNEKYIKNSQGIKVDFNADNKSSSNYFVSNRICRTFNYSASDFSKLTNLSSSIQLEYDCLAIGLQDGLPDVLYYISFTEFPSGVQINYTTMFQGRNANYTTMFQGMNANYTTMFQGMNANYTTMFQGMDANYTTMFQGMDANYTTMFQGRNANYTTMFQGMNANYTTMFQGMDANYTTMFQGMNANYTTMFQGMDANYTTMFQGMNANYTTMFQGRNANYTTMFQGMDANYTTMFQGRNANYTTMFQGMNTNYTTMFQGMDANYTTMFQGMNANYTTMFQGMDANYTTMFQGMNANYTTMFQGMDANYTTMFQGRNANYTTMFQGMNANYTTMFQGRNANYTTMFQGMNANYTTMFQGMNANYTTMFQGRNANYTTMFQGRNANYTTMFQGMNANYTTMFQGMDANYTTMFQGRNANYTTMFQGMNANYTTMFQGRNANYTTMFQGMNANYTTMFQGRNANYTTMFQGMNANYTTMFQGMNANYTTMFQGRNANYTTMFQDGKQQSMQLLAGAWLTWRRAHFVFLPIRGISSYTFVARSGRWTFSRKISSSSVIITDIPNSSKIITATVTPNATECERLEYWCSPITLTLMDKNSLNLPADPPTSPEEDEPVVQREWDWRSIVIITIGAVVAAVLLVVSGIIYKRFRISRAGNNPWCQQRTLLWIAEAEATQRTHAETYLKKNGFDLTHALPDDAGPAKLMRNHDIIVFLLPSSLIVSPRYEQFVQIIIENKPLWKKVRVISYAEGSQTHLLPSSSVFQRLFKNYTHRNQLLLHLDKNVYSLPEEGESLVQNLREDGHGQLGRAVTYQRRNEEVLIEDTDETMSFVTESVLSESVSYVSELSEVPERRVIPGVGRRGPSSCVSLDRHYQTVPEENEDWDDCGAPEQLLDAEASQNNWLSEASQLDDVSEDPEEVSPEQGHQVLAHDPPSSQHEASRFSRMSEENLALCERSASTLETESACDSQIQSLYQDIHETHRKQLVEESRDASEQQNASGHRDASELLTESDSLFQPPNDVHETLVKEAVEGNADLPDSEEENQSAAPVGKSMERNHFVEPSAAGMSDHRQSAQGGPSVERRSDSSSAVHMGQEPTSTDYDTFSSVSTTPSAFPDLAVDFRREPTPLPVEEEGDGQDSDGYFEREENSLQHQENADAFRRPRTCSIASESGGFDDNPIDDRTKVDHFAPQCGPSVLSRPAGDSVRREESVSCESTCGGNASEKQGNNVADADGGGGNASEKQGNNVADGGGGNASEKQGNNVADAAGGPSAQKKSEEMQDAPEAGFVPRNPPSVPSAFPDNGDFSNGNLPAGSTFRNHQRTGSSAPSNKDSYAEGYRRLLEFEWGLGRPEVQRGSQAPCEDPHYARERDGGGERCFTPDFVEEQRVQNPSDNPARCPQNNPGFPVANNPGFPPGNPPQGVHGNHVQPPQLLPDNQVHDPPGNPRLPPGNPAQHPPADLPQRLPGNPAQPLPGDPAQFLPDDPAQPLPGNPAQPLPGNIPAQVPGDNQPPPVAVGHHGNRRVPVEDAWPPEDNDEIDSGRYSLGQ